MKHPLVSRTSLRLFLAILCLLPAGTSAAREKKTRPAWAAKIDHWRTQRATDQTNFGIFCEPRLLAAIEDNRVQLLACDPQAADQRSQDCKFVVIRSRSAKPQDGTLWEKGLTIPVRWREQPVCIADVRKEDLPLLGRMMRSTLILPEDLIRPGQGEPPDASVSRARADARASVGGKHLGWVLSYHLPNWITMPVLHGHGMFRLDEVKDRVENWESFLHQSRYRPARQVTLDSGSYTLFVPGRRRSHDWDVVAVARRPDGGALPLHDWLDGGGELDLLAARMVQDVYLAACSRGTTAGHVMIDRDDERLVVRAVRRRPPRTGRFRSIPLPGAVQRLAPRRQTLARFWTALKEAPGRRALRSRRQESPRIPVIPRHL